MYSDNFEKEGYTELDFIAAMKTSVCVLIMCLVMPLSALDILLVA